ncbi:MAG: siphovirus Gp157 family protein [Pseudomonadota bacterium]
MGSTLSLYQMTEEYRLALTVLAEADLDEQTVADTLEGLEGELSIKAANVAAFVLNIEAEAEAARAAEERIKKRRQTLEKRAAQLRDYLLGNMRRAGIAEIAALDQSFRARVLPGREAVVVDDEQRLPADYLRVKFTEEPDKTLIARAIREGHEVPGAHLERRPTLKIG